MPWLGRNLTGGATGATGATGGINSSVGNLTANRVLIATAAATLGDNAGLATTGAAGTLALLFGTGAILSSPTAAVVQHGAADAASPVAQTIAAQSVVTGTSNGAGAAATIKGSLSTGLGIAGAVNIAGSASGLTGTSVNAAVTRQGTGWTKVLTNNSPVTVVSVANASNSSAGGVLHYLVEVFNGTDVQTEVGVASYMVTNKAGAFSGNTVTKAVNAQNMTSGTLAVTIALSAASPALLSVNANSSLSPSTGYPRIVYTIDNLSPKNDITMQ